MVIFIWQVKIFEKHKSFVVNNKTIPVVLSGSRFNVDIDTKKDFNIAKSFI